MRCAHNRSQAAGTKHVQPRQDGRHHDVLERWLPAGALRRDSFRVFKPFGRQPVWCLALLQNTSLSRTHSEWKLSVFLHLQPGIETSYFWQTDWAQAQRMWFIRIFTACFIRDTISLLCPNPALNSSL